MVNSEIERYCVEMSSAESGLLGQMVADAERELEYTDMLSGPLVGGSLAMLVRIGGARRVLEIGTFTGYSALWIASALPEEGELITCEYNERYIGIARKWFDRSECGSRITLVWGPAMETIPDLEGRFDLVFLDADKINYPNYCDLVIPRLTEGGLLVIDNVLWSGSVLDPADEKEEAIDRTNRRLAADDRVEQVMLPVRDGLTIVRKRAAAENGNQ